MTIEEELEVIRHTQETIVREIAYIKGAIDIVALRLSNLENLKNNGIYWPKLHLKS